MPPQDASLELWAQPSWTCKCLVQLSIHSHVRSTLVWSASPQWMPPLPRGEHGWRRRHNWTSLILGIDCCIYRRYDLPCLHLKGCHIGSSCCLCHCIVRGWGRRYATPPSIHKVACSGRYVCWSPRCPHLFVDCYIFRQIFLVEAVAMIWIVSEQVVEWISLTLNPQ